jgi:hypothetical protein
MLGKPSSSQDAAAAVAFLVVARIKDQAVLAKGFGEGVVNDEKKGFPAAMDAILQRLQKTTPYYKDQQACTQCEGTVCAWVDADNTCILFAGLRDKQYPERVTQKLLRELSDRIRNSESAQLIQEAKEGALTKPLTKPMRELLRSYGDAAAHDKAAEAQKLGVEVQGIMKDNVKKILESHQSLDRLQEKSSEMTQEANKFLRQSRDLKSQMGRRDLKVKIIVGVCSLALVAYFVLPFIEI